MMLVTMCAVPLAFLLRKPRAQTMQAPPAAAHAE
jgi:hypothetical protein